MSIARTTPAQKPRGWASRTSIRRLRCPSRPLPPRRALHPRQRVLAAAGWRRCRAVGRGRVAARRRRRRPHAGQLRIVGSMLTPYSGLIDALVAGGAVDLGHVAGRAQPVRRETSASAAPCSPVQVARHADAVPGRGALRRAALPLRERTACCGSRCSSRPAPATCASSGRRCLGLLDVGGRCRSAAPSWPTGRVPAARRAGTGVNGSYGSEVRPTTCAGDVLAGALPAMPRARAARHSSNQMSAGTGLPRWQV